MMFNSSVKYYAHFNSMQITPQLKTKKERRARHNLRVTIIVGFATSLPRVLCTSPALVCRERLESFPPHW